MRMPAAHARPPRETKGRTIALVWEIATPSNTSSPFDTYTAPPEPCARTVAAALPTVTHARVFVSHCVCACPCVPGQAHRPGAHDRAVPSDRYGPIRHVHCAAAVLHAQSVPPRTAPVNAAAVRESQRSHRCAHVGDRHAVQHERALGHVHRPAGVLHPRVCTADYLQLATAKPARNVRRRPCCAPTAGVIAPLVPHPCALSRTPLQWHRRYWH
jgi:hypothetical protein